VSGSYRSDGWKELGPVEVTVIEGGTVEVELVPAPPKPTERRGSVVIESHEVFEGSVEQRR